MRTDKEREIEIWKLIRKTLRGSDELDRMKGEIDRFVRIVKGLVDPYWWNWTTTHCSNPSRFVSTDQFYIWEIDSRHKKMRVRCLYRGGVGEKVVYSSEGVEPSHERVREIYRVLPELFNGLHSLFNLPDRLRPFIEAADAAGKVTEIAAE